jgi:hypothetical protein
MSKFLTTIGPLVQSLFVRQSLAGLLPSPLAQSLSTTGLMEMATSLAWVKPSLSITPQFFSNIQKLNYLRLEVSHG